VRGALARAEARAAAWPASLGVSEEEASALQPQVKRQRVAPPETAAAAEAPPSPQVPAQEAPVAEWSWAAVAEALDKRLAQLLRVSTGDAEERAPLSTPLRACLPLMSLEEAFPEAAEGGM
jgi:hypothetical protein